MLRYIKHSKIVNNLYAVVLFFACGPMLLNASFIKEGGSGSSNFLLKENVTILLKTLTELQSYDSTLSQQLRQIDSLKNSGDMYHLAMKYIDISTTYRLKLELAKAKQALFKSLKIMSDLKNTQGIADANSSLGMYYWRRSKYDSAIVYMKKGISLYKKVGDIRNYAIDLNSLGSAYYQLGLYDKALANYIESNKLRRELKDYSGISKTYINIGMIFRDLSYYKEAKKYFEYGLVWARESNDSDVIGYSYNSLGSMDENEGKLDSALYYYIKSMDSYKDKGYSIVIMNHTNVGRVYLEQKKYAKAKTYLESALELAKLVDDRISQAEIYKSFSLLNLGLKDYEKAISFAGLSLKLSQDIGSKEFIKDNYKILSDIYESRNDKKKALEFYKKYHENYIAMFNQEVGKKVSVLEEQNEMEKQRLELSIKELELQKEEVFQNLITIAAVVLLLIAIVLYYFNRKIKRSNTELKGKNLQIEIQRKELDLNNQHLKRLSISQNKLFSILAHDLRNPFHSMLGYSELLIEDFNHLSKNKQLDYIKTIKNALSSTYNLLVNLLFWTQANTGSLEKRIEKFDFVGLVKTTLELSEPQTLRKNITINFSESGKVYVIADKNMVEIVIRNLITNAIKYSLHDGEINVDLNVADGMLYCTVKDEGIGLDDEAVSTLFDLEKRTTHSGTDGERGTGLGLILCKEFVELNEGEISVKSVSGKGSSFTFSIPLADT